MAKTGDSEKQIGIEGDKALVTLVTYEASKLRSIAIVKAKTKPEIHDILSIKIFFCRNFFFCRNILPLRISEFPFWLCGEFFLYGGMAHTVKKVSFEREKIFLQKKIYQEKNDSGFCFNNSYRGKRDNDVSRERSDRRSGIWDQDPIRR
jgi:hypothetical protein